MRREVKHWNVSMTREDLDVARRVFSVYMTHELAKQATLSKQDVAWLREVDRVGRKLQHTGPK